MMKLLGKLFWILGVAPLVQAEEASWKARLLERGTRKPLGEVNVFVMPSRLQATTAADGSFSIEAAIPTEAQLVINHPGYKRLDLKLNPAELPQQLFLERDFYGELGTTVIGNRDANQQSRQSIGAERFLNVPGAGGDPVKAVQNLPGINRSPGFSSQVVIQGSGPEDTAYQIDGHEVPIVFHFGGLSSVVFPEAIDRVDTLSAGYGVQSSRALGGIVQLWTRPARDDKFRGLAFVDLGNSGVLLESPVGKNQRLILGFRQSYIGWVLQKVFGDNEDFNLTVAPSYRDFNARWDAQVTPTQDLSISAVWSQDQARFLLEKPVESDPAIRGNFENETRFWRIIPRWKWTPQSGRRFDASLGMGQDFIFADFGENDFEINNLSMTPQASWSENWSESFKTQVGWDHLYNWTRFNIRLPNTVQSGGIVNPLASSETLSARGYAERMSLGFFVNSDFQVGPWTLSPHLRWDTFREQQTQHLNPRPQIRYAFSESSSLRMSYGRYSQAPLPQETDDTFGNPNLKVPRSEHLVLGWAQDNRGGSTTGWRWNTDLFYKHTTQIVIPSSDLKSDGQPLRYNNEGLAQAWGLQAELRYSASLWQSSLIATLSRVDAWTRGQTRRRGEFDQPLLLGWLGSYNLTPRWTLAARIRFASGNPYTPVSSAVFDADSDTYIPVRGELYSKRLPDFFQVDFRVDRKWIFDTWILSAYLDLQNITNRRNAEGVQYSYDYVQNDFSSGLPFLPILGLKGEF